MTDIPCPICGKTINHSDFTIWTEGMCPHGWSDIIELVDDLQTKLTKAILALEKSKLFIETYVPNMAVMTIVNVLKEIKP